MKPLFAAALLASAVIAAPVSAAPITGIINFTGSNSWNTTTHVVDFLNPANVSSDTIPFTPCNSCALFAGASGVFNYSAAVPAPPAKPLAFNNLIVASSAGAIFSFDLATVVDVIEQPGIALDIDGTGTLHLTGFDATPGTFFFSTQGPEGIEVSFSATDTATAVSEPLTLAVIAAAFFGLALFNAKSRKAVTYG